MNGKLIVLTGLDGSGTSSVAEELHKLDATSSITNSIVSPYTICRDQINKVVGEISPAAHYLFYLSATVYTSCLIKNQLKKGNVYCVRYLVDTVVSHRVAGLHVNLEYENAFAENNIEYITPDEFQQAKMGKFILNLVTGQQKNKDREELISIINDFEGKELDCVVLACTDLQLLIPHHPTIKIFDTMKIFADATVHSILES